MPFRIVIVALLCIAALGAMIWDRVRILEHGRELVLEVQPVDPRDFFRGDYVILTYAISRLEIGGSVVEGADWKPGDPIYVTLEDRKGVWEPLIASKAPPATDLGPVIKGRVDYVDRDWTTSTESWMGEGKPGFTPPAPVKPEKLCPGGCPTSMRITYGIESYFVPEGEGRDLETLRNDGKVAIQVAVDKEGRAAIKGLLVDGRLIHSEGLF